MAAKDSGVEAKRESTVNPIKRLVLKREKVRELRTRSGLRTGFMPVAGDSDSAITDSDPVSGGGGSPPYSGPSSGGIHSVISKGAKL